MEFARRFTKIKGVSNIRRLPRVGKIGLGIKQSAPSFSIKDVEYFIVPEEVKKFYGDKPTELNIVFPLSGLDENGVPDLGGIYPQALKLYGSSKGLKCTGDGETAIRANEKGVFEEVDKCPCELFGAKNGCKKIGTLLFFLPRVSMGGVYAIDSGSWNSLVDVQSGIALAQEMLRNPYTGEYNSIAMLPFKLRRTFKMVKHGDRQDKHWPLTCTLAISLERINQIREGLSRIQSPENLLRIEGDTEELRGEIKEAEKTHSTVVINKETGEIGEETAGAETGDGTMAERPYRKPTKAEIEAHAKKKVEEGKIRAKEIQSKIDKKKKEEEEAREAVLAEVEKEKEIEAEPVKEKVIDGKEKERILKEAADKFVSVGIIGWKYVSFYACLADVIQPGTSVERLQDIISQDNKTVDKIIAAKKKREKEK